MSLSASKQFLSLNFFKKFIIEARPLNNLLCYYTENDVSMKVRGRATSKTWTRTLDPDLKKTWTLKNLDSEKPGP